MALGRFGAGSLAGHYDNVCATHLTCFAVSKPLAATRLGRLFAARGHAPANLTPLPLSHTPSLGQKSRRPLAGQHPSQGTLFDRPVPLVSRGMASCSGFRPVLGL